MRSRAELSLALAACVLGIAVAAGIPQISAGAGYDRIGPRFFPSAVAGGLLLVALWLAVADWRGRTGRAAPAAAREAAVALDAPPLGYLALAALLFLALLERAGFVAAASVQFWLVARGFRSRRPVRDAAVALLLSVAVYVGFSYGLGLTLPAGPFEDFF